MKHILLTFLFAVCYYSSAQAQNCKSLTWHTPNPYSEDMTEAKPKRLDYDSLAVVLNYDCTSTLAAKDVEVWIDDIPPFRGRARIVGIKGRTIETVLLISPGTHKVVVKAGKTESPAIWLRYEGKADLYVFSVGVPNDLDYTTKDAQDIANAFESLRGRNLFGDVHTYVLNTPANTSKSDILGGLDKLQVNLKQKNIRDWDFVIIYLSSHGFVEDDTFYFQCKDFLRDRILYSQYAINQYELKQHIEGLTCKKLLLIDACHSGGVTTPVLADRGGDFEYQIAFQKLTAKVNALSILTASTQNQEATEHKKWENGAFTEAFLEALTQGKGDKNKDAIIDLKEISEYVKMRVPILVKEIDSHKTQTPVLVQDSLGGGMPIFATRVLNASDYTTEQQAVAYYIKIAKDAYFIGNYQLAFDLLFKYKDSPDFDAEAQFMLGYTYHTRNGVAQDYYKAVEWYRKAAEQGLAEAQYNLGLCYEKGQGVAKSYEKAAEWYRKSAEQGDANAQCKIGYLYDTGNGVTKDYNKAVEWYRKAAEQGDAEAQYNLGFCYEQGRGVAQSDEKAVEWWQKAAEQGDASAQTNLAAMYNRGRGGLVQSNEKAVEWWQKAAKQGNAIAQAALGVSYYTGKGVEKDDEKAAEWWQKAAEQGNANAQYLLGVWYQNRGTLQYHEKAIEWLQKAARQGVEEAQKILEGWREKW